MSSRLPTLIVLGILLFSSTVIGQTVDSQARALFREGHALGKQAEEAKKRLGLEKLQEAIRLYQQTTDRLGELGAIFSVAYIAEQLGEWKMAREHYFRSMSLFTDGPYKRDLPDVFFSIGRCSMFLGERLTAIEYFNRAGEIWKRGGELPKVAIIENDVGALYYELGEYDLALKYLEPALEKRRQFGPPCDTAATLSNIAVVHIARAQWTIALDLLQKQALPLHGTATECEFRAKYNVATDCPDILAGVLTNIGKVYYDLADYKASLCFYERAIPFVKYEPLRAALFNNLGTIQYALKNYPAAMAHFEDALKLQGDVVAAEALTNLALTQSQQQSSPPFANMEEALRLRREIGDPKGEAATRNSLAEVYMRLKRPKDALENLNRAIPLFRSAGDRSGEATALTNTMTSWRMIGDRAKAIADGKLAVERFQELRIEVRGAGGEIERTYLRTVRLAYQTLSELLIEDKQYEQAIRVLSLYRNTQSLSPAKEPLNIAEVIDAQQALMMVPSVRAVSLYTLVTDNKLYILAVTPGGIKVFSQNISSQLLDEKVKKLIAVLRCADLNPYQAASELYDLIFKATLISDRRSTLATALKNWNPATLLWSLDQPLNAIPMAALYDSVTRQYLIEKYQIAVFTRNDAASFKREPKPWLNGIGMGTSRQFTGQDPIPGAEASLAAIFGDETTKQPGVLPGKTVVNEEFTAQALDNLDGQWPLVHIVSHFVLTAGEPELSFLRLGDGDRYTLAKLQEAPDLFAGVELLSVPICESAVVDADAYGKETEALANLAQGAGARSVIASLWKVSYHVTPKLMSRFYELAAAHPDWSKSELLRQAQLSLLRGDLAIRPDRAIARGSCPSSRQPRMRFVAGRKTPFAHPYYWAAFVLYGNAR